MEEKQKALIQQIAIGAVGAASLACALIPKEKLEKIIPKELIAPAKTGAIGIIMACLKFFAK